MERRLGKARLMISMVYMGDCWKQRNKIIGMNTQGMKSDRPGDPRDDSCRAGQALSELPGRGQPMHRKRINPVGYACCMRA